MDQPKLERLLRIMQLLAGNEHRTLDDLAAETGLSRRSLFRYLDTFRSAGFAVQRVGEGIYRLAPGRANAPDLEQLIYFTREEAVIVSRLIENLSPTNALRADLKRKLAAFFDATSLADYVPSRGREAILDKLEQAIKGKRQIALTGYSSSRSGRPKDYILEPYAFTAEYADIWAWDTAARRNKLFKLSRIDGLQLLDAGWQNEQRHAPRPVDPFRMSGKGRPVETVRLRLTLRAKNLLAEEFPLAGLRVARDKNGWYWEGGVNALEGVGRFVLGLPREVTIEKGRKLREWVKEEMEEGKRKYECETIINDKNNGKN
ncbi:MAG: WYL domain-containing protein [Bacteroidales bacterium]|nr:WYL domain-containing protein [Bacteroidales bacterium]